MTTASPDWIILVVQGRTSGTLIDRLLVNGPPLIKRALRQNHLEPLRYGADYLPTKRLDR